MDMPESASNARKRTPEAAAFAAQLRAERAAAHMNQDDLAKASGVSKPTIARIETGVRVMDMSHLAAFCRALGISLSTFAERAEARVSREQREPPAKRRA